MSLCSRRPPVIALAIAGHPPLARPRPRELVVRLEEDLAHAFLGRTPPADFCNTTRRAGTPIERPILVRESRKAAAPHLATDSASLTRDVDFTLRRQASLLAQVGTLVKTSRASVGGEPPWPARAEGTSVKDSPYMASAPPENTLGHPGRRIVASGGLESLHLREHGRDLLAPPPREG